MNKVRIIVGLPGSGKTYYAEHNPLGILFDDPAACNRWFQDLKSAVMSGADVTITDVYAIEASSRTLTLSTLLAWNPRAEVEWVFFANDPEACEANVARRNDDRDVSPEFITEASKHYEIPEGTPVLAVYKI